MSMRANFVGVPDQARAAQARRHVLKKLQQSIQKAGGRVQGINFVNTPLSIRELDVRNSGLSLSRVGGAQWCLENDCFRITMAFKTEIRGPDSLELTRVMKHNAGSVKALLRERHGVVKDWASLEVREALQSVVMEHQETTTLEDLCWICGKPKSITNQDGVHRCMVKSRFSCGNCGHKWGSGCAWIDPQTQNIKPQLCCKCGNRGEADSKWEAHPQEKSRGMPQPLEKQHRADLCEACLEWGDCRNNFLQPNVVNGAIALACGAQNMHWYADEEGIKTKLVYNGHENEVVVEPFVRVRINDKHIYSEKAAIAFFNSHIAPQHGVASPIPSKNSNYGSPVSGPGSTTGSLTTSQASSRLASSIATSTGGSRGSTRPTASRGRAGGRRRRRNNAPSATLQQTLKNLRVGPASSTCGSSDDTASSASGTTGSVDPGPSYLGTNLATAKGTNKRRERKRNARHRRKKGSPGSGSGSAASSTASATIPAATIPSKAPAKATSSAASSSEVNDDIMSTDRITTQSVVSASANSHSANSASQLTSPPGSAVGSVISPTVNMRGVPMHPQYSTATGGVHPCQATVGTLPNTHPNSATAAMYSQPPPTLPYGAAPPPLGSLRTPSSGGKGKGGEMDPRAFVDKLEQLCRMRRHGNITDEEFERLKTAMLFA